MRAVSLEQVDERSASAAYFCQPAEGGFTSDVGNESRPAFVPCASARVFTKHMPVRHIAGID
jgi:hypothetical protein